MDPLVAVLGHIPLSEHHLAGLGRLARASALLLMYEVFYTTEIEFEMPKDYSLVARNRGRAVLEFGM